VFRRRGSVTKAYHVRLAGLVAARCCKELEKLTPLDFSRDPEGTLGTFWGSMCYFLNKNLGNILPFRKRHESTSVLLSGLGGRKILQKAGKVEMSGC
jgi:hypothetical protein